MRFPLIRKLTRSQGKVQGFGNHQYLGVYVQLKAEVDHGSVLIN